VYNCIQSILEEVIDIKCGACAVKYCSLVSMSETGGHSVWFENDIEQHKCVSHIFSTRSPWQRTADCSIDAGRRWQNSCHRSNSVFTATLHVCVSVCVYVY